LDGYRMARTGCSPRRSVPYEQGDALNIKRYDRLNYLAVLPFIGTIP
jgi:hypothetical protein